MVSLRTLFGCQGFDELLDLAETGDHRNVDMLVKDIYGGSYDIHGLPGDIIASSFGKAAKSARDQQCKGKSYSWCIHKILSRPLYLYQEFNSSFDAIALVFQSKIFFRFPVSHVVK